jgi:tetratricopeptide (TPR) repeat protein
MGDLAVNPYFVKEACMHLYSIEELCYYVYNNAFLLDDGFVNEKLVTFVRSELNLEKLADHIEEIAGKSGSLSNLARILNNEVGYYTENEWSSLIEDIESNSRMSLDVRKKVRADGLLKSGRFGKAMEEYENILCDLTDTDEQLIAGVYHNLGVCAAKMFLFEKAAGFFQKAYENYANTESYQEMLLALKLSLEPTGYLNYLSDHKESYEDSLEVERKMEILRLSWGEQPAYKYLKEIEQQKEEGGSYYESLDRLTDDVKGSYRGYVNGTW